MLDELNEEDKHIIDNVYLEKDDESGDFYLYEKWDDGVDYIGFCDKSMGEWSIMKWVDEYYLFAMGKITLDNYYHTTLQ